MDITRLIAQARGTLPWFIPLMLRIGLLKSHWANRTIRYTTTLHARQPKSRLPHSLGFSESATSFPGFLPRLILEFANDKPIP